MSTIQVRSNEPTKSPPPPQAAPVVSEDVDSLVATDAAHDKENSSVQKDAGASEASGNEDGKGQETELEVSTGDEGSENDQLAPGDSDKSKPQKKGGFQRRIDKLNSKISAKDQELEYWKQQALRGASESKPEQKIETKPNTQDGKPDPSKFETHAEYVEALTDWKTDQKLMERDQRLEKSKLQAEQEQIFKTYQERLKSFSDKYKDFDEVIAEVDGIPMSPTFREIILTSENGPAIAYELAKSRVEFERVNRLNPLSAAKELGRIEYRLSSSSSEKQNESKKITSAPRPLEPVGAGGKGSAPKSIFDSNLSQYEYESIRKEQNKRRRSQ